MSVSEFLQAVKDGRIQPRKIKDTQKRVSDEFRSQQLKEDVE